MSRRVLCAAQTPGSVHHLYTSADTEVCAMKLFVATQIFEHLSLANINQPF